MAHMNGFAKHGLDDDAFGEKSALSGLKTFDAFREYLATPIITSVPKSTHSETRSGRAAVLIG
jgi:hypothetical protein